MGFSDAWHRLTNSGASAEKGTAGGMAGAVQKVKASDAYIDSEAAKKKRVDEAKFAESAKAGQAQPKPEKFPAPYGKEQIDKMKTATSDMWQSNTLTDYDNVAYHFTLYMGEDLTPNEQFMSKMATDDFYGKVFKDMKKVVLAESGITGINIRSVELDNVFGPNPNTGIMAYHTMKMEMVEPVGVFFYQRVQDAVISLGVSNHRTCPYWLELRFSGYNRKTGKIEDSINCGGQGKQTDDPNKSVWLWKIRILRIDSKMTFDGGTMYTVAMIPFNEIAGIDVINTLNQSEKVSGSTPSDLLNGLANELTKTASKKVLSPYTEYSFEFAEITDPKVTKALDNVDLSKVSLVANEFKEINNVKFEKKAAGVQVEFPKGTPIDKIITGIFSNTTIGQKFLVGNEPNPKGEVKKTRTSEVILRIDTDYMHIGWDPVANDYARHVKFIIRPEITTQVIDDKDVQKLVIDDTTVQAKIFQEIVERGALRKRYDYAYTGLNTEVKDFEFSFNMMWFVKIPDIGPSGTKNSDVRSASSAVKDAIVDYSRKMQTEVKKQTDLEAESRKIKGQEESKQDKTRLVAIEKEKAASQKNVEDLQMARKGIAIASMEGKLAEAKTRQATFFEKSNKIYAEVLHEAKKEGKFQYFPVSFDWSPDNAENADQGSGDNKGGAKTWYSVVIDQLTSPGQMQSLNLTIKGDPYWLGKTNVDAAPVLPGKAANMHNMRALNETIILLKTLIPTGIDVNNGVKLEENSNYTGFYRVISIKNKFEGGLFTQTLSGNRHIKMNWDLLGKDVQAGIDKAQVAADQKKAVDQKNAADQKKASEKPISSSTAGLMARSDGQVLGDTGAFNVK